MHIAYCGWGFPLNLEDSVWVFLLFLLAFLLFAFLIELLIDFCILVDLGVCAHFSQRHDLRTGKARLLRWGRECYIEAKCLTTYCTLDMDTWPKDS